jgi:hypothetical protein
MAFYSPEDCFPLTVERILDMMKALTIVRERYTAREQLSDELSSVIVDLIQKTDLNQRALQKLYRVAAAYELPGEEAITIIRKGLHPMEPVDYFFRTPLAVAYLYFNSKYRLAMMELLLDKGSDPSGIIPSSWDGDTILACALKCNDFEVSELLLRRGASVQREELRVFLEKERTFTPEQRQILGEHIRAQWPNVDLTWP